MKSLHELEAMCQKPHWRTAGSLAARRFARPVALYLTYLVIRWPISPHTLTTVALLTAAAGAVLLGCGSAMTFFAGVGLLWLWYVMDHVDGQVARYTRRESVTGIYLDFMMHHVVHPMVAFALGYGLAVHDGQISWALAGAGLAAGLAALGLANDCKYKAFFCQLVRDRAPLSPRRSLEQISPKRPGIRLPFWIAYKLCEFPNVLIAMAMIVAAFSLDTRWGYTALRWYLAVMAVLAPLLAAGRISYQVWTDAPGREYRDALWPEQVGRSISSVHAQQTETPAREMSRPAAAHPAAPTTPEAHHAV